MFLSCMLDTCWIFPDRPPVSSNCVTTHYPQPTRATASWVRAGCCGCAWCSGCSSCWCSASTSSSAPPWPAASPGQSSRWSRRRRRPACTQCRWKYWENFVDSSNWQSVRRTTTRTAAGRAASTGPGSAWTTRARGLCQLLTSRGLWARTIPAPGCWGPPASPTPASRQPSPTTPTPDQVRGDSWW